MRHGMMFMTVVKAQTHHIKAEVFELTEAYIEVFVPGEKSTGGTDHERAVKAVRDQLRKIEEKPKATEAPPPAPAEGAEP